MGLRIMGMIALAIAFFAFKHHYDEGKRDEGRTEIQEKWDVDKAQRIKALADMALLWSNQLDRTEAETRKRENAQRATTAALEQRSTALSRAPTVVISSDAARLWGDVGPGSAGAGTADPAKPEPRAVSFSESALLGFVVAAKAAYEDAVGLFHSCRDTLNGYLTTFNPKERQ